MLLAAVFLREIPTLRQCMGMTLAFAGLALIGLTIGADLKLTALGLALAGACSWAVGNVLVKRTSNVAMFPLVVWCSLIPPVPALLAPCTGIVSSTVLFGEVFSPLRYSGMALILGGLAVIVLPADWVEWLHPGRKHPNASGDISCNGLTEGTLSNEV